MKRKRTNEILFNFKSPIQSYFQKKNNQKTRNSNLLYPSITHYHCKFQTLQLPRQISLPTIHYQVFDYITTSPFLRNPSKNGKRPAYTRCSVIRDTTEIIFLSLSGSIAKIYQSRTFSLRLPSKLKYKNIIPPSTFFTSSISQARTLCTQKAPMINPGHDS